MAQGRSGDNGHVKEPGVAQKVPQLRLLRQRVMESSAIAVVPGIHKDNRLVLLPTLLQVIDKSAVIGGHLRFVSRLGQHQEL